MGWSLPCAISRTVVALNARRWLATALLAAFSVAIVFPAHAQMCKGYGQEDDQSGSGTGTSGSGEDQGSLDCDLSYHKVDVKCRSPYVGGEEVVGTMAPCPKDPMPMKATALKSLIKDFSPYLFAYASNKDESGTGSNKPYTGTYFRGTPGEESLVFKLYGDEGNANQNKSNDKPGEYRQMDNCINQIDLKAGSVEEQAKIVRLQLDNCANQFILKESRGQGDESLKQDSILQSNENPDKPDERISLKTHCQPLRTRTAPEEEYDPTKYHKLAWEKLLQNPSKYDPKRPKEPRIEGLKLQNPIPYPSDSKKIALRDIAAIDYEEIIDPSHPYTPRWDFENNERDEYSPKTEEYSSDTKNSVFCAGIREGDEKEMVKVDILSFRKEVFDKWMTNRIAFNTQCYKNEGIQQDPCCLPVGTGCEPIPCWKCYGLSEKSDSESILPPCATHHSGKDKSILPIYQLTGKQAARKAPCTADNTYHSENKIKDLCSDLRRPFTPMNRLKMRYHNPENDPDKDALYEGAPEGYTFKEYFGQNMPYPRLWDIGTSIQKTQPEDVKFQPADDYYGQWTSLVGVGREGVPKAMQQSGGGGSSKGGEQKPREDERCLFGGWGEDVSFGGVSIEKPNGITSWTELKLYQTRPRHEQGVSCIPRYEKAYKPGSAEAGALMGLGAEVPSLYVSTKSGDYYEFKTLEEAQKNQGAASGSKEKDGPDYTIKQDAMTLAWRGYLSSPDDKKRFPNLGGGGSAKSGLDNAECGDIVIMEKGATQGGKPGLPSLGKVVAVNLPNKSSCGSDKPSNCASKKTPDCYVEVQEWDNGKFPDVCGTTDTAKQNKTRRLYKTGMLPQNVKTELEKHQWTTSCEDTKLSKCEMKAWSSVKLYSPVKDERKGKEKESAGAP